MLGKANILRKKYKGGEKGR
jgi:hypothetical protein